MDATEGGAVVPPGSARAAEFAEQLQQQLSGMLLQPVLEQAEEERNQQAAGARAEAELPQVQQEQGTELASADTETDWSAQLAPMRVARDSPREQEAEAWPPGQHVAPEAAPLLVWATPKRGGPTKQGGQMSPVRQDRPARSASQASTQQQGLAQPPGQLGPLHQVADPAPPHPRPPRPAAPPKGPPAPRLTNAKLPAVAVGSVEAHRSSDGEVPACFAPASACMCAWRRDNGSMVSDAPPPCAAIFNLQQPNRPVAPLPAAAALASCP